VEEEIDDTLRFNCDSSLDRTALTLPIVGAEEAEAEGVGRQVGAAANSGERTRTSATSRDSRLEASWRKRHKRVRVLSRSSRRFGKKKNKNVQEASSREHSSSWSHLRERRHRVEKKNL